jgi:E3 ubiquitin-protein ligase UBR7
MDDASSDASSSGLPPPLIPGSKYESLVCASCVSKVPTLKKYAGTPGVMIVFREEENQPWKVLDGEESVVVIMDEKADAETGSKRSRSPTRDEPDAKRTRVHSELGAVCLAPRLNLAAQTVFNSLEQNDQRFGTGDLFLTDGFRARWCRCPSVSIVYSLTGIQKLRFKKCLPPLEGHPYLLTEEDTYEPPEDPDSGMPSRLRSSFIPSAITF